MQKELQALREKGYQIYFYNFSGFINSCLICKGDENLARGISICSPYDEYKREEGLRWAFNRAKTALETRSSEGNISIHGDWRQRKRMRMATELAFFKSQYKPNVWRDDEKDMVERRKTKFNRRRTFNVIK